jgi:allantoinase
MALAPGRFAYAPVIDRPIIKWPDNARVAFWVAPNMEFFEYLPESPADATGHPALRAHGHRSRREPRI